MSVHQIRESYRPIRAHFISELRWNSHGSSAAIQTAPDVKQFVSDMSEAEMHRRAHVERGCMTWGRQSPRVPITWHADRSVIGRDCGPQEGIPHGSPPASVEEALGRR